jgi:hypothetical protein
MEQSPPSKANSHSVLKSPPPTFYGTRRFIAMLTRARHWSLSWARFLQFTPSNPISPVKRQTRHPVREDAPWHHPVIVYQQVRGAQCQDELTDWFTDCQLQSNSDSDPISLRSLLIFKLSLCLTKHHAMKTYWGVEVWLYTFLTSALDGGEWSASQPGRFTPNERAPGTHCIGGWVGPRAVLDTVIFP